MPRQNLSNQKPAPPPRALVAPLPFCPSSADQRPPKSTRKGKIWRSGSRLLAERTQFQIWASTQFRYNLSFFFGGVVVPQPTVGLIGLGLMGLPMGHNLLKAGFPLAAWNRTASRADSLVAAGAKLAASPREVAAASGVLLTIVSDPPALEEVLWGGDEKSAFPALKKGTVYIDSSTVSPALARKIAAACTTAGVRFLDAPVTGGTWGAEKG